MWKCFIYFRLIDTGQTGTTSSDLKITSLQFDAKASAITLKWNSAAGKNYAIDYTQNLGTWPTVLAPLTDSILAAGATEQGANCQGQHPAQRMLSPLASSDIGQGFQGRT